VVGIPPTSSLRVGMCSAKGDLRETSATEGWTCAMCSAKGDRDVLR
jgi:hypothetical protein